ncbi:MAG: hypothetical protein BM557_00070 [Flavobacterium sp. MedPE-SWcel]|uniref:hypothetical protein n=1 Tax=uncultured Flavobacterium sp. TaxID=165435 RepID=UPI0009101806|nr:hypothetical protein [uncultured Flavobacterium sp.]OIQ22419.1 MAG: hypothetical protein BM557_00070 [Flavobacterium sp. MedPE-SWcel]
MKQCFKHKHGYISIDQEKLYLSQSNDWSTILKINRDLSNSKYITKDTRKTLLSFLNYLPVLFLAIWYGFDFWTMIIALNIIALLSWAIFLILDDKASKKQAMIPLDKIESIEPYRKNGVIINYLNRYDESDEKIIKKVEKKGIEHLLGYRID